MSRKSQADTLPGASASRRRPSKQLLEERTLLIANFCDNTFKMKKGGELFFFASVASIGFVVCR